MENIWGIVLQTVTVSLVACILLMLKGLLADKFSPRWQYSVWIVLALRALLPVSMKRDIFGPLPLWMEMVKSTVEAGLGSVYSAEYEPIFIRSVIPIIREVPVSVTDWLFVIYVIGMAVALSHYLYSYLTMRRLLKQGEMVSSEVQACIRETCQKYRLRRCKAIAIKGLPSPFISGVFRPILAVPAETVIDEKIILHELMHLRHGDMLQSIFWCFLRCLHWFNPLLQYVFDRIGNDMESLCDQRVLERLEGEQRREYGVILLGMVNNRYARVPGTSSISNGGRNISRRIEAIVRFKKYPGGMAVAAICSIAILLMPALVGTAADYPSDSDHLWDVSQLPKVMAISRLSRCETKAAALDTYAKGLIFENGLYIAMVSPMEKQAELEMEMKYNRETYGWAAYHLDSGWELEYTNPSVYYGIYNLKACENGEYEAVLGIQVKKLPAGDGEGYQKDENGERITDCTVLIPVRLRKDNGWIVEECEERRIVGSHGTRHISEEQLLILNGRGETGTVTVEIVTEYYVDIPGGNGGIIGIGYRGIQNKVDMDAKFAGAWRHQEFVYDSKERTLNDRIYTAAAICVAEPATPETEVEFADGAHIVNGWGSLGLVKDGSYHYDAVSRILSEDWDGTLSGGGSTTIPANGDEPIEVPTEFQAAVYWDGLLKESIHVNSPECSPAARCCR